MCARDITHFSDPEECVSIKKQLDDVTNGEAKITYLQSSENIDKRLQKTLLKQKYNEYSRE